MKHSIAWFEIPVSNLEKSIKFYETILGQKLRRMDVGDEKFGILPHEEVGGTLVEEIGYRAPENGTIIYLDGGNNLESILNKVPKAGGKIIKEKTNIDGEHGYYAWFKDLDGNRLGIYQEPAQ